MTVPVQIPFNNYVGNAATTAFPYTFLVLLSGDLVVKVNGVTLVNGIDYTVTGIGVLVGGLVTMTVAPASLATVAIYRSTAITRAVDYQSNGDFLAPTVNSDFDRPWLVLQELFSGPAGFGRMVKAPVGETIGDLPAASVRAGNLLSFDSNGNPLAVAAAAQSATQLTIDLASSSLATKNSGQIGFNYALGYAVGTVGRWLQDLATSAGSSLIGFVQSGTGAVLRTLQSKGRDTVSVADFGVVGSGDETVKVQAAVDSFTGVSCTLDLVGLAISITTVNIPNAKAVTVKNGSITVIGAGSMGLSKVTTTSPQSGGTYAKYDLTCENVKFTRLVTGGACVRVGLAWQDATGGVVIDPSCNFQLSNGAVGMRLSRCFFSQIDGRFFMDATSTGLLCDASEVVAADAYPSCPFTVRCGANFTGGIGFDQVFVAGSTWNSFEGFTFSPGCSFYASEFRAKKYNLLKCVGVEWNSAKLLLDSGNNTIITGGYTDRNVVGDGPLMTVKTTYRNVQQFYVGGGFQCNAQGSVGDMIVFTDSGALGGTQITNVVIGAVSFIGGINDVANQINGIKFNHVSMRNVNVTGEQTFQNLYGCLYFVQAINRSVIKQFDARDISWYAVNVATGYGATAYNRFDGIYRVITVDILCASYASSGAVENIHSQVLTFDSMMRPPVVSVSAVNSYFGAGYFTIAASQAGRDTVWAYLVKNIAAPSANRGGCSATLTLDASQYLAPL